MTIACTVTAAQLRELRALLRRRTTPVGHARRARVQELHVVLDNSSTHGTAEVKEWLAKNPRVQFHYTPTSASWLNHPLAEANA
jgi:hypothetical protein